MLDNSQKPIEELINSGLAELFFKKFGVPLLFSNAPDVKKVASEYLKKNGQKAYPFVVGKVTNWAVTENSYKPNTLLRKGLHGSASADYTLTYRLNLIPVTTIYEFVLYIQDFKGMREFAKKLLASSVRNDLSFSVTYAVADIDINIKIDKNISVPSREGGVSEVKEYQMISTITVFGYMSEALQKSQAVTQLETELAVLEELGKSGGAVTLFSKDWLSPSCPTTPGGGGGGGGETDANFVHTQTNASSIWIITHGLHKFPSVTVVNDSGAVVEGLANFPTEDIVIVSFGQAVTGRAFLN